jgi:hypothetical protein
VAATITQVSQGLKTRLATITGLRTFDYQPDNIYPPIAYISLTTIEYHKAMGGGMRIFTYTITVVTGRVDERTGQDELDAYASYDGSKSVRAALEGDKTLGGVVDTLIVTSSASVNALSQGDNQFITLDFTVTVYG